MEPKTENMGFIGMNNTAISLLPHDGEAIYYPGDLLPLSNPSWLDILTDSIAWSNDTVKMFGKTLTLNRKSAWYGDPGAAYSYSGIRREPLKWTEELLMIKKLCEEVSNATFNSVLCNYYHDGKDGMGWHCDDERELGKEPIIASVSFGAERIFAFKHRNSKERINIRLEHGSMLIMRGQTQHSWQHALPKSTIVHEPRINLTFRNILM
ncbi:MAG: alpha-ketoglutarate-dependent dioxygenase AlkB [Ignavibacteriae bacterium]|nr:alpha-ketoglutarate-dependent dioxygenase AlkB [Ignavibacteriota bacterium]